MVQQRTYESFELKLQDPAFEFMPVDGEKLTFATCDVCACYSDALYMEVSERGDTSWSSYNVKPDYIPEDTDTWDRLPGELLGAVRGVQAGRLRGERVLAHIVFSDRRHADMDTGFRLSRLPGMQG